MDFKDITDKISAIKYQDVIASIKGWDRKTWIYVGSGALAGALFFLFLFMPAWVQRPILKKQFQDAEGQMARLKALTSKQPQLEAQKKEIQALVDGFQKKVFSDEEASLLLGKISKLAQDAQVELLSSKPVEGVEPFPAPYSQKYAKFIYQITVEGTYHNLGALISLIESYPRYLQVQSLSIASQTTKPDQLIADIKVMAVSHNAAEPK